MASLAIRPSLVGVVGLFGLAGCPQLSGVPAATAARPPVPEIQVSQVTLESRPSNLQLAAFYCNEAAGGGLAAMACRVFGDTPSPRDLQFAFKVELAASNPSPAPM